MRTFENYFIKAIVHFFDVYIVSSKHSGGWENSLKLFELSRILSTLLLFRWGYVNENGKRDHEKCDLLLKNHPLQVVVLKLLTPVYNILWKPSRISDFPMKQRYPAMYKLKQTTATSTLNNNTFSYQNTDKLLVNNRNRKLSKFNQSNFKPNGAYLLTVAII